MKALILISLLAIFTAGTAHACLAFFKYEYVSGMNKICVYNHLGSDVAITVSSVSLCPLQITVPDY